MKTFFNSLFLCCFFLGHVYQASAWGPIAHYSLQRDLGVDQNQVCMNLPDAWPNREWLISITTWFAWTHGGQTNGTSYLVPLTPTYPDDGRYPGYDIYRLATQKRVNDSQQAENTAYSFIGHNALDREVHYGYFLGGTSNNWIVQHGKKEEWADYELYVSPLYGGGEFNSWGAATRFFGAAIDSANPGQVLIPCSGNAEIIQIAQKAYRKNRRFTGSGNTGHLSNVDTITRIDQRIQDLEQHMNDGVRNLNFDKLQELRALALENNWTLDDLETRYQASLLRAEQRLAGAGN